MFWNSKQKLKILELEQDKALLNGKLVDQNISYDINLCKVQDVVTQQHYEINRLERIIGQHYEKICMLELKLKDAPESMNLSANILLPKMFIKIIKAGRAKLLMTAHPDHGGSRQEFEEVEAAYKQLKSLQVSKDEDDSDHLRSRFYDMFN